jgi:predicted nucleic acid-binding protein
VIRYLDTSAIAKVVLEERHTQALRTALSSWSADELVSSQLMATELHRVMTRLAVPQAAAAASAFELIELELEDFVVARDLAPATARTLDVLHVAVALRIGADVIVTYDRRQAEVADAAGLEVLAPE